MTYWANGQVDMWTNFWTFIKQIAAAWSEDKIPSMSAALAYYTLFSLTPILLICISIAGLFFGPEAAQGRLLNEIAGLVGQEAGKQIQAMIETANKPVTAFMAQLFGIIALIFGASGVFSEIQSGLNTIWHLKANPQWTWFTLIKQRFLSFTIVLGLAFLLLVSLIQTVFLTAISGYITISHYLNIFELVIPELFSFFMNVLLFAMIFKLLPDVVIKWKEVWLGAIITTILLALGKYLLGIYLSHVNLASAFGAAGSLVILLIWVYYTAQIFFIGAVITKIVSTKNRKIVPTRHAVQKNS